MNRVPKTAKIQIVMTPDDKKRIDAIAQVRFEGNISQTCRFLLLAGVKALGCEAQSQAQLKA